MEFIETKIKLPKLDGYEYTGEFRPPKKGEWYVGLYGTAVHASYDYGSSFHLLRKSWQEPRTADGQPLLPHGWLARDEGQWLWWYNKKPERHTDALCWDPDSNTDWHHVGWLLPDCPLTWDDEPLEVGRRDA